MEHNEKKIYNYNYYVDKLDYRLFFIRLFFQT